MAKLVAVCRDEEFPFERRQIPLTIEETLTMVMEIPETVISTEWTERVNESDVFQFTKRYNLLTLDELTCALVVSPKDLFALLAVSVPCVGCRRSVERLYNQLWESKQPALEPLLIQQTGVLSIAENFLFDPKLIYALFYIHGSHLNDMVDTIPKSRRNRRCLLHSLETHKARSLGWMDVWDLLSQECRDEVVLIDSESLLDTLENYLRKHRFCSECKSKVLKAYSILCGEIDGETEKGYCKALYDGLRSCPKERHVHVLCETDFIAHLIGRAEPELAGGRRERHARTIDIAQEEVLTCLGIHLWERLHRLWQKLRAEEQTWQMLFYLGVEALRKSFETAVENKQGISRLEQVVEEISEAERAKELRKEAKRLKKKKRKENKCKYASDPSLYPNEEKPQQEEDERRDDSPSSEEREAILAPPVDSNSNEVSPRSNGCQSASSDNDSFPGDSHQCSDVEQKQKIVINESCQCGDEFHKKRNLRHKNGYNKGYESSDGCYHGKSEAGRFTRHGGTVNGYVGDTCKDCGPPLSPTGKYKGGKLERHTSQPGDKREAYSQHTRVINGSTNLKRGKKKGDNPGGRSSSNELNHPHCRAESGCSGCTVKLANNVADDEELRLLIDMGWQGPGACLSQDPCLSDEEIFISEQEIRAFKANRKVVQSKRQELREKLREKFEKLSVKSTPVVGKPLNGIHIK